MGGMPKLDYTRSLSRYGLSQVTVVFKDGTDIYFARQLVNERIQQAKDQLPPGCTPRWARSRPGWARSTCTPSRRSPARTKPAGEPYSTTDLRTIQDWIIKPQLRTVPGIVEVNTIGGYERQFHVLPDPARLIAYKLTFRDVMTALARQQRQCRRGLHRAQRRAVPGAHAGPGRRRRRDRRHRHRHARRRAGPHRRRRRGAARAASCARGAATLNGEETVIGTTMLLIGENSRTAAQRVAARLDEIAPVAARRRRGPHRLRPHASGRSDHRHGREEPARRRAAGRRRAVPRARQFPRRLRHRLRHPAVDAVHHHRHGREQGQRQPDEPRRHRFRHHRRRRRDRGRELPAPARPRAASARPRC